MEPGETLVYECDDFDFVARTSPGQIGLYLPDEYRVLGKERSGSGFAYRAEGISLRGDGRQASLDVGDRRYRGCTLNPARVPWEEARRRGVDFRAVGQEPGWYLEIQHERNTLLVAGYGDRSYLFATAEPDFIDGVEIYELSNDKHLLRVEIRLQHCVDSMSGQTYDSVVSARLDGQHYQGCGTTLESFWE